MKTIKNNLLVFIFFALIFSACKEETHTLPKLGIKQTDFHEVNGKTVVDTIYHRIPDFVFTNQDNQEITNGTFKNKIYIADFFFTTCPTICPKMKSELLRVYEKYKDNNQVFILSHTIDPEHDTVEVLKEYAKRLGVESSKWHFVTAEKDYTYDIAENYLVSAQEDKDAPGGFIHSGALILIDKDRHVRGQYDGTNSEEVDHLMADIDILLNEK